MNDAQLKMILDAMASMGAAGKEAFVWWLAMDKGLPIVGWLAFIVAMVLMARMFVNWGRETSRFDELRERAGLDRYSDPTFQATIKKALAALSKENGNK